MNVPVTSKFHLKSLFLMAVGIAILILFLLWNSSVHEMLSINTKELEVTTDNSVLCSVSLDDNRPLIENDPSKNIIYFVTPTYSRPEQAPELTRLGYTLMHVPRIHWIVADDNTVCSKLVEDILRRTGLPFTHIASPMPNHYRKALYPPRGVANRRAALNWIAKNAKSGVVYFGDDDNTFDLRLFDEIRNTKKVSMFPVGLIGDYGVSSPVVHNGKVIGFFDSWQAQRIWPVDMAGFAINLDFLKPNASMPFKAGYEEDQFLQNNCLSMEDIEAKAKNCTEIYVWHTQAKKHGLSNIHMNVNVLQTNPRYGSLLALLKQVTYMGMGTANTKKGAKPYITKDGKTLSL